MNSIESKIINDYADSYLSILIDRIIAQLDKSPNDAVEKKLAADLASVWEAICVQLQGDYFDNWEEYEIFISEICFNEIEKETPELISILSYFICHEQKIQFNYNESYSCEIVEFMYEVILDRADDDKRPSIKIYLKEQAQRENKFLAFKLQFEAAAEKTARTIIQQIEEGAGKWEMPWHKGMPFALNRFTGRMYSGLNQLRLWEDCTKNRYKQNHWATLWQWNKMGGKVIKGSKSTKIMVVFEKKVLKDKNQMSLPNIPASSFYIKTVVRYFSVFNQDQVSGLFYDQPDLFNPHVDNIEALKLLINKSGANIQHGGVKAFYRPSEDFIQMPYPASFKKTNNTSAEEAYYTTLLHELIHWTGHSTRCCRFGSNYDKKTGYAFEELVAELGCAMLSTHFGQRIYPRPEHARYINSWLKVLLKDFRYFYQAQNQALIAINWLFRTTDILSFDIKERPVSPVSSTLFEEWETLSDKSNQNNDGSSFQRSILYGV
jgi:antirestriction protein ArdC